MDGPMHCVLENCSLNLSSLTYEHLVCCTAGPSPYMGDSLLLKSFPTSTQDEVVKIYVFYNFWEFYTYHMIQTLICQSWWCLKDSIFCKFKCWTRNVFDQTVYKELPASEVIKLNIKGNYHWGTLPFPYTT